MRVRREVCGDHKYRFARKHCMIFFLNTRRDFEVLTFKIVGSHMTLKFCRQLR